MNKSNFRKAAVIGMCCTIISSGIALAMPGDVSYNEMTTGVEVGIENDLLDKDIINSDASAPYENRIIRDNTGVGVQINGEWLQMDVKPFIENNRTLIPLRGVMEELGAKVEWYQDRKAVEVSTEDIIIELVVGEDTAKVIKNVEGTLKEETIKLDVPAKIVDDITFIPGRFVAEALGAKVDWSNSLRAVIIETGNESDVVGVERAIDYEIVDRQMIEENELLSNWYQNNCSKEGIYSLADGEWRYVLVSAGEKSTGGYSLQVDSVTEVTPGTAYVHATLSSPDKDDFVTQALTYPNVLVRFNKEDIEQVQGDLIDAQQDIDNVIRGEIGESLKEMEKAISIDSVKEMKLYSLMQEEIKEFTSEEVKEIITQLNTSSTYDGPYIEMIAGNSIKITLEDEDSIQLTSYGFKDHVIMSGKIDGEYISYCIVSPEIGSILLSQTEYR